MPRPTPLFSTEAIEELDYEANISYGQRSDQSMSRTEWKRLWREIAMEWTLENFPVNERGEIG